MNKLSLKLFANNVIQLYFKSPNTEFHDLNGIFKTMISTIYPLIKASTLKIYRACTIG